MSYFVQFSSLSLIIYFRVEIFFPSNIVGSAQQKERPFSITHAHHPIASRDMPHLLRMSSVRPGACRSLALLSTALIFLHHAHYRVEIGFLIQAQML